MPANEYPDGTKEWYKDGRLHRDGDLPAIEWASGNKSWLKDGLLHRDGGKPAIERVNEDNEWYQDVHIVEVHGQIGSSIRADLRF